MIDKIVSKSLSDSTFRITGVRMLDILSNSTGQLGTPAGDGSDPADLSFVGLKDVLMSKCAAMNQASQGTMASNPAG